MFWQVIGRILWARRLIVATVALSSLAGGMIVAVSATPLYDASARVMLNITAPDPVTGATLGEKAVDPYIQTQLSLIRDYQVVGRAIEAVGWLDDPDIVAAYDARSPADRRPFPLWLAQSVSSSVRPSLVEGSNIVKITYRGESPELAELMVGAIRDAYITANISMRRSSAVEQADQQAARVSALERELRDLETRKRSLEAETGIVISSNGSDIDGQLLSALSSPPKTPGGQDPIFTKKSSLRESLNRMDVELAQATATLGPNHPRLIQTRALYNSLLARAAQEERDTDNPAAAILQREGAKQAALEAQKSKVLMQRQDLLRLRLLQDQINVKAKTLATATQEVANLRQMAFAEESGLTPVGQVEIESEGRPAFPNLPLVIGGTGGIGLFAGIVLALLVEMLNLRVRTTAGLRVATNLPVLGSVPRTKARVGQSIFGVLRRRPAGIQ